MAQVGWENSDVPPATIAPVSADADSFETIYADHREAVLALVYVMSGTWQLAEDVTQEAFIKLIDAMGKQAIDNPAGWAARWR